MNEVIHLAIIFDFSHFTESSKISENITAELSKLLLFLQTWNKIYTDKKRKLYISFQISSFNHQKFYRQQYFQELDQKIWNELKKCIQGCTYKMQHEKCLIVEPLEKYFLFQLQRFGSDFYWENNDLCSPVNTTLTKYSNSRSMSCMVKKNIALYVTHDFYPFIIESRNTLKAIITTFQSHSIAFMWLSQRPNDQNLISRVINCLSLFNGHMVIYDSHNSLMSCMYQCVSNMKPVKITNKIEVHEIRNRFHHILRDRTTNQYPMTITTVSGTTYKFTVNGISAPQQNLNFSTDVTENCSFIQSDEVFFISIDEFIENINADVSLNKLIGYFRNITTNIAYCIQKLLYLGVFIIFPPASHFFIKDSQSSLNQPDFFSCFDPWFTYRDTNIDDPGISLSIPPSTILHNYLKNCLNGDHLTFSDSKKSDELKSIFGLDGKAEIIPQTDSTKICDEFRMFEHIYNDISRCFASELEKYDYLCTNYVIDTDSLIQNTERSFNSTSIEACKSQILVRIFLLNKFWVFLSDSDFISQVIKLLRKFSLWKMPHWVGHFLKHDILNSTSNLDMIKQFRRIYDELCHPYPPSLISPNHIKEQSCFLDHKENKKALNSTNEFISGVNHSVSFNDTNTRRRQIMVTLKQKRINSCGNIRRENLNHVKRSLFGNCLSRSGESLSLSDIKYKSGPTVFSISPELTANSFDFQDNISNPSRFYIPNSLSNASLVLPEQPKISPDNSYMPNNGVEETNTSTHIIDSCTSPDTCTVGKPSLSNSYIKSPTKKYSYQGSSLWNTTPFKYYKLPPNRTQSSPSKFTTISSAISETINPKTFTSPSPKRTNESSILDNSMTLIE